MSPQYEALVAHLEKRGGAPFGLLSQQVNPTADILHARFAGRLACLLSPEHGWFGLAGPGEKTSAEEHPLWHIPIHALYGETRRPTPAMLAGLGALVVDLQDIGVRCYTYLATLKLALEAAAEARLPVVVFDRPVPLGGVVDGPGREAAFSSFVAPLDIPLCHGMTPGECARYIAREERLDLDLTVIAQPGWSHAARAPWPNFMPPSPGIRSWDSAVLYPATVFTEAYPALDCDRQGPLAFRVLGAPWLEGAALAAEMRDALASCGLAIRPLRYRPAGGTHAGELLDGVLLVLDDPARYRPATAGALLYAALWRRHRDALSVGGRDAWLDKLLGSADLRRAVAEDAVPALLARWAALAEAFRARRVDLYPVQEAVLREPVA